MTTTTMNHATDLASARRDAMPADRPPDDGRRSYRTPGLRHLGDTASLIEVLGPAQAGYGGVMGP